ncbi:hybrid sensor histidine kinase/response regulator [Oxynema aestuarii]|jgi:signal transduction histidine kinase|uniref:histidine kinase n=1 Tax=Oxynema aestuarii AP17 TaxID=2064643 RepID=A0A6H1U0Z5_9CYAN|nr:ATP-binding protein [Oxynema aestuarii]QIZ72325.1 hybrid sensor histidine kinase/response regulator [Oxynema aestuarii AP17]RMH74042.1 MAG: hybrid sensor histidine kinase/response regulator [Cyanobacteria bacterium J007]
MSSIKILIVEDEAIVGEDIASHLESMGYEPIDIVGSGEEAINMATHTKPDLILMDIMLQGQIDGIETANRIQSLFPVPIVYLTAYADEKTLKRAKITHPFGYIIKPFTPQELKVTIEISLSRFQAESDIKQALVAAENERRQAEENSHLKSQYISMAAHDFRNPLTTIKTSVALLKYYSDRLSDDKKEKQIDMIESATKSLNELLEDVLTLSRTEESQLSLELTPVDISIFCESILEPLRMAVGDRYNLTFSCDLDISMIYLDAKLMWHVLNNLLSNAIKYSPDGGAVDLSVFQDKSYICFQVRDRGIGIDKGELEHLFQPFHRARNVGNIPGTGLGLAIVKRSVDLHEGRIEVNSELGSGTVFNIYIPCRRVE